MCSRGTTSLAGTGTSSVASSNADFFFQGGRKICVGDCALFKPPSELPPFVGIIRSVNTGKENHLKLGVNWLYRHSDVKLGKGILLEAVPNEIFYSFHKDEIPAASLLHPCKVAFLPQSVELPSGVSSFVCRRVYDITNKRLWWLTDQDYSDQHQEEVNLLLNKTRVELLETVEPGAYSSKTMNGPTSSSLLKSGSDNVSNVASFPAQGKGKKRERGDQGFEPVKRALRNDDGDSAQTLKSEIAKITDRGGLVDSEAVGKLVHLMLLDKADKKVDLVNRSMLAGVIAATDKFDCLSQFVQLRGLPVFDEWLQEVHKGKIYESTTVQRDGDKPVEEFLLVLLRSLDKLPVNINALQMCNIGKSVNHLRTHKNVEIQKKARTLVDTWKKRVEAEMNIIDSKSGSNQAVHWPGRPRVHEVSQGANRHNGGSDVAAKSLNAHLSASKPSAVRTVLGESNGKSGPASPGSMKPVSSPFSVGNNLKDVQSQSPAGCSSDFPLSASRDEKSSSSSPSHNSHSCSSEHIRTVGSSGKEDARSSTAGSLNMNKISGGVSRSRKTNSGLSGAQRETGPNRMQSSHKIMGTSNEKTSQSGLFCDKAIDIPVADGNSHKLIVKIPNCSHSPSRTTKGGAFGESSLMSSRSSSPVQPGRQENCDGNFEERNDATVSTDVNIDLGRSLKFKDSSNGFREDEGSPTVVDEEICQTPNGSKRSTEMSKPVPFLPDNDSKAGKVLEASFNSMNHFIDSCVKYSEVNSAMSFADDGMILLASVAAGEMSTSDLTLKADSPGKVTTLDNSCAAGTLKSCDGKDHLLNSKQCNDCMDENTGKQIAIEGTSVACVRDGVAEPSVSDEKPMDQIKFSASHADVQKRADITEETIEQLPNARASTSETASAEARENADDSPAGKQLQESEVSLTSSAQADSALVNGENAVKESAEALTSFQAVPGGDDKNKVDRIHKISVSPIHSHLAKETFVTSSPDICVDSKIAIEKGSSASAEMKFVKADTTEMMNLDTQPGAQSTKVNNTAFAYGYLASAVIDQKDSTVVKTETKVGLECHVGGSTPKYTLTGLAAKDESEKSQSETLDAASATVGSDLDGKVKFDLNEGFNADEGKCEEPSNLIISSCSAAVNVISPVPIAASSVASNLPTSITVAAAAKGPFVPPDDLLRTKGELGWKGSAATSAFRRAEPRKMSEIQLNTNTTLLTTVVSSKSRSFLDIDLNVADDWVIEETPAENGTGGLPESRLRVTHNEMGSAGFRSSGKLDLDLNQADEATDVGSYSSNNDHRLDVPLFPARLSASGSIPNDERNLRRGFDLNDGPALDEVGPDVSPFTQQAWNSMPSQPTVASIRPNNTEMGQFSWFPSGNIAVPSVLPDRAEQHFPIAAGGPQRIFAGATPLGPNIIRAPLLSSSPAAAFASASYQYPVLHFGTNFPTTSVAVSGGTTFMDSSSGGKLSFSPGHSHLLGPASTISSSYPRPYIISLSDGNTNATVESNSRWGRQGLDLNAGPGSSETDGREKTTAFAIRQPSVAGSQALTEEQARMYQAAGVVLKRKEPEGGWDADKYKQHFWQ